MEEKTKSRSAGKRMGRGGNEVRETKREYPCVTYGATNDSFPRSLMVSQARSLMIIHSACEGVPLFSSTPINDSRSCGSEMTQAREALA